MRAPSFALAILSPVTFAACAPMAEEPAPTPAPPVERAEAVLRDASGAVRGDAVLVQLDQGIRLVLRAEDMAPGVMAAHIHMTGRCEVPGFTSAGGHWNPLGREHGRDNPAGQHMGDMPNLIVGQDGMGLLEVIIIGGRIDQGRAPLLDEDGAALMIHAGPDDYRSDPAGDAGPRIACGVIEPIL
ncbi:superoxide dismutase family protein [Parasphingopyxis lamellibrachiae]|uniref:Superoxide dismutase [Cu-Zn] n=1 Tax=Parasphingopyxis lamellibrachiae TaxID=680125 RepID=A0A3D9FED1_9SPHN|nr:superoxide dismutase family protein [Parasphingopyxis lamellibrachiae]RED16018.1 Cu-Zn family superoxide dismutase [Parasphingopyxis lamellibrachiae]